MAMRLRWKISIAVAALGSILAGLAATAPYLVDVEAYKPGLIQAVREATGRELVIDGPMRLTVFPVPGIGAGQVHFSNPVGAQGAQMIDVRWVAVTPSWWALLHGRIEVGTLTLYRPTIALETDADGRPNWQFAPGAAASQQADAPSSGLHLAIGRLSIVQGEITYRNPRDGATLTATEVNGGATVRSLDGPFEIDGKATVNGVPLKLDVAVGAAAAGRHPARLSLELSSGRLEFKGTTGPVGPDTTVQGHLSVETGLLSDFVNAIWSALGGAKPNFDTSGAGRFSFDGDIDLSPGRIAADDFDIRMGNDAAKGSLSLAFKPVPTFNGKVSLSQFGAGKWLDILSRPIDFAPAVVRNAVAVPAAKQRPSPWSTVDAHVAIDAAETYYHHDVIHDLSMILDVRKGVIGIPRLEALLPGDMKVEADSSTGRFSLSGTDLRRTLTWLDVDVAGVPSGKLRTLEVNGKVGAAPGSLQVSDARFTVDGVSGTTGGTLFLRSPLSADVHAEMDSFDLEAYRPRAARAESAPKSANAASTTIPAAPGSTAGDPKIGLKLKIGKLAYRGQTLNGVAADATMQGNVLQLANVTVADAVGAKLGFKGSVIDFGTAPRFDLAFTVAASDADRLLDYAHLPHFLNGRIGAATASGGVAGTSSAVTLRDVALNFLGTESRLSGSLSFGDTATYDFPTFFLHTHDASALVSAASGRAMSSVGYIRATGSLKGTSDKASFTGEIRARGSRLHGRLDTTLGAHPKIVATLTTPGTVKVDRWLGIDPKSAAHIAPVEDAPEPTPTPATPQPINLTALRAFDLKLSLQAGLMTLATLRIENAGVEASLTNGVARIARLAGQFYGGSVAFGGTIDASGTALSIDMAGDVHGIAVDRLLQGTVGKNTLSSSGFSVAIGGKVDATGVRIAGKGVSSEEIRNTLSGTGTVSGFLNPVVVDGSPAFASFAASIGGIFSAGLAFDAQVLNSFIGRQSPISGRFELGTGGLAMENQTIRGANTVAVINGRASFADDTIDTTVTLDSGSNRYVTTVKGPLSSPVLNTTRSSAR
jgi:uncharacterized protein involved in outer membrane biogenesis